MKKKFYIKSALLSLTVMTLLSSCLKDPRYVDFSKVGTLIEFPLVEPNDAGTGGELQAVLCQSSSVHTQFKVAVNVAAPTPLSSALNVTVSVDATALSDFNTSNGTNYTLLPAADYSSTLAVTVPANQNLAYLPVVLNSSLLDPTVTYALPLTITNASGQPIAQPYKTIIFTINATNKYDGIYTGTGSYTDATGTVITSSKIYPETVSLTTLTANSVLYDDLGNQFEDATGAPIITHAIVNAKGSPTPYINFSPQFTFNTTTNKVTGVANFYTAPPTVALDPTGANTVIGTPDAAGSFIVVKYNTSDNISFNDTLTYAGLRPAYPVTVQP